MIIQPSKKSPLASASKPGLMSPSDKNKLDEIDIMTGATPDVEGTSGLVPVPAAGDQDKFLKADGTWGTPTDTKYSEATTSKPGLMSAADKAKLDEIDVMVGSNGYSAGKGGLVPTPNAADCEKFLKGDGTWSKLPDFSAGKDDNSLSYINGGI